MTALGLLIVGVVAWVVTADSSSRSADGVRTGSSATTALSGPTTTSEAAGTAPAATPTAPPRDPVLGNGETVTIAFGGDTNFDGSNAARLESDPSSILAGVAPVLSGADLAVVNMETAMSGSRGWRVPFLGPWPQRASLLRASRWNRHDDRR